MCSLYDIPLTFRAGFVLLRFIRNTAIFTLHHITDINFIYQHAPDGASYEYYTDDGETKDYDKPEHFVHITLDADGNAKSDRATVKVEG